jgi:UDP-glucose 6-dehydrogenase
MKIINSSVLNPRFGFGGACYLKDASALCHLFDSLGIDFSILKEIIRSNKK